MATAAVGSGNGFLHRVLHSARRRIPLCQRGFFLVDLLLSGESNYPVGSSASVPPPANVET
jgi:hypothetical protein